MRIFLIGRGMVGSYLAKHLEIPADLHWNADIEDVKADDLRAMKNIVAVINAAGKTDLSWCENNPNKAFQANVVAPLGLSRAVKEAFKSKVPFIHMSSGCVWDGPYTAKGEAFAPEYPPTPACFYAWTKAVCDAMLQAEADEHSSVFCLRPRQIFSGIPSLRNTLDKMRRYESLVDTENSMTSLESIEKTIRKLLENDDWRRIRPFRIFNVYDRGIMSPYGVGKKLAMAGLREDPKPMSKRDLDTILTPRRVDVVMRDFLYEQWVDPPCVLDTLNRAIDEYGKSLGDD